MSRARYLAGRIVAAVLICSVFAGCSSGSVQLAGNIPPTTPTTPGGPGPSAVARTGRVVLPTGSALDLKTLSISNAFGTGTIDGTGGYRLNATAGGPQFTLVTNARGKIVLAGFLGDAEPNVSAHSTAELLVYYALGGYALSDEDQLVLVSAIGTYPGVANVEQAIAAGLRTAGSDPLTANGPAILSAISAISHSLHVGPPRGAQAVVAAARADLSVTGAVPASGGRVLPQGVTFDPAAQTSGLTMIADFPNAVHFQNVYRRSAEYYVDEVSPTAKSLSKTPLGQIPSVQALGGFNSTLASVISGAFAFSQISTAPISLPAETGAAKTVYKITVIGPGVTDLPGVLTSDRILEQSTFAASFYFQNIVVPLVLSIAAPIGKGKIDALFGANTTQYFRDGGKLLISGAPAFAAAVRKGDFNAGLAAFTSAFIGSSTYRATLVKATADAAKGVLGTDITSAFSAAGINSGANIKAITTFLTNVDVVLASTDFIAVIYGLQHSNTGDVFNVTSIPEKVTLTPAASSIANGKIVDFTAKAVNASDHSASQTLSYQWTNVPLSGTVLSGHLTDAVNGHLDSYTSNSFLSSYKANATGIGTDLITVTVFAFDNATGKKTTVGSATATVQVGASSVTLVPASTAVAAGSATPFKVTAPTTAGATGYDFHWSTTVTGGTLTGGGGHDTFVDTATTPSDTVAYAALIGPNVDTISVDVVARTPSGNRDLGKATATITTRRPPVSLQPPSAVVANGASRAFEVVFAAGPDPGTSLTYGWSNTATIGHITDGHGHTDNFTSTFGAVIYTTNPTGSGSDTISAHVLASLGARHADLGTVSATAATSATPAPIPTPPVPYGSPPPSGSLGTQVYAAANCPPEGNIGGYPCTYEYPLLINGGGNYHLFYVPGDLAGTVTYHVTNWNPHELYDRRVCSALCAYGRRPERDDLVSRRVGIPGWSSDRVLDLAAERPRHKRGQLRRDARTRLRIRIERDTAAGTNARELRSRAAALQLTGKEN